MSELMRLDEEYRSWIQELGDRYRTSQIKASIRVNNEMLMYDWPVGKDIKDSKYKEWIDKIKVDCSERLKGKTTIDMVKGIRRSF